MRLPTDRTLHIKYPMIVNSPEKVTAKLAEFLDLKVSNEDTNRVTAQFTKAKVKNIISTASEQTETADNIIALGGGKQRVKDMKTGFQTSHVSDYQDGDWRRLLGERDKREMNERLAPFLKVLGYEIDR